MQLVFRGNHGSIQRVDDINKETMSWSTHWGRASGEYHEDNVEQFWEILLDTDHVIEGQNEEQTKGMLVVFYQKLKEWMYRKSTESFGHSSESERSEVGLARFKH